AELVHRTRILLADPAVLTVLGAEFSVLLVDEYPESDPAQIGLISALASAGPALLAAGDPDQAIFRFRGAHPRALTEFSVTFGSEADPTQTVVLPGSYRCRPGIEAAVRRVARRLPLPALPEPAAATLRPSRLPEAGREVVVRTCASDSEQAALISEGLRRAHLDRGIPYADMAVLVRSGRRQIAPIARALTATGIAVEVAGDEIPLGAELAVRPLLLALDAIRRRRVMDPDEARRMLASPLAGLDAVALRSLGRQLQRADQAASGSPFPLRDSAELMAAALSDPQQLQEVADSPEVSALISFADSLERAEQALVRPGAGASEALWELWRSSPWPDRLRAESEAGGESGRRADADLDALCALFDAAAESEQPPGLAGLRGFLAEVAAQEIPADTEREDGASGGGVRLLTVHRAKGRQWPIVVVAGVQEGIWPDLGRGGGILVAERLLSDGLSGTIDHRARLADERRLFLVACSRASEQLLVTAVSGSDGEANQPSRFLAELGVPIREYRPTDRPLTLAALVSSLRRTAIDPECSESLREAAVTRLARLAEVSGPEGQPLVPQADPSRWWGIAQLTTNTVPARTPLRLSATQLQSLMSCPRQFFLGRRAQAEASRSSAANLGTVIHLLVEHARVDGLSEAELAANLDRIWDQIPFDAAWMSASERDQAEQALARFVAWQDANSGVDVVGVEVPFEVDVTVDDTRVTLTGSVDRLERLPDGRLRVIDFKTGRQVPTKAQVAGQEQLGLYQLAIESGAFAARADGAHASAGGVLVQLRKPESSSQEGFPAQLKQAALSDVPQLSDDPDDLRHPTWIHARVARATQIIGEGHFEATPGGGCRYCAFTASCPSTESGKQVTP
ncbi:MAG: ATP-dependent DNA helicase, partial [Micropruina sp.]